MFAYVCAYGKLQGMGELSTQRLRLVPLEVGHVQVMHDLSVDPEVRRYLFEGNIIPVQQVEQMIADSQACFDQHGVGFYAMYIEDTSHPQHGAFVGFCGFRLFEGEQELELLLGMQPRFWGHGYGQEAAREVMRRGFDDCGFARIVAATDTPNQRSVQVLQRLGMSFKERREWHGLDTMFYELTVDEYRQLP